MRRLSTGALVRGRVVLLDDDVAQFTFDSAARLSDAGNVYCSLDNVTGGPRTWSAVYSPPTHVYVLSQYTSESSSLAARRLSHCAAFISSHPIS